jgi:eukaryotic-like serine/threonine-protein kinase
MSARPVLDHAPVPLLRRLGKYDIVGVLGQGAMGIVYDAIDPDIHRRVAVKAIRAPLLGGEAHDLSATQRFRTEARAAGRLTHPNIVSIYEYGQARGEPRDEAGNDAGDIHFIAMEFVDGVSLLELSAAQRRLPIDDVTSVMTQLLDALECAHAQGVWHRDIKPANLLIASDGRLKVTDFGIACIESSDLTLPSSVLGSSGYMAPERYTGAPPDGRIDIFSCGVLLYELLTGSAPFRGSNSQVMYQVLHGTPPPPPSTMAIDRAVLPSFDDVVARAIARNPDDRYASAAQMHDALRTACGRPIAPKVSIATMLRARPPAAEMPTTRIERGALGAPSRPVSPCAPSQPVSRGTPSQPLAPRTMALDAGLLAAIEARLVPHLGPVARLVVRDAARRNTSVSALVACIAAEALDAGEREAFIAATKALLPAAPRTAPAALVAPVTSLPVLGTTPMGSGVAEQAQRVLAQHIGPIAVLMVQRALKGAASREQFFAALADQADQAGSEIDRKQLIAQLWRIG